MSALNKKIIYSVLFLFLIILACGGQAQVATEIPTTVIDIETTEGAPPTEVAIQHNDIPVGLPEEQSGQASDFDSSGVLGNETLVGGDRFTFGRFERPFNANAMDLYFSQLDIVNTKVFQDDTWIYAMVVVKELTASSSISEKYAVEIDADLNGKGDWLVISFKPESSDWSVQGVQIFQDTNKDVGLDLPTLTDESKIGTADGFETKVFDQGQGNDPDSAWVRISPNNPNAIEFAIKRVVLGNSTKFLINMWAGTSLLNPALFDINDQFTHEQAGAADKGLESFYPIKEVAEIDNSCRVAVGFQPTGIEPGLCFVAVVPESEPSCLAYGNVCSTSSECCNNVPCTGGRCRYP